MDVYGWRTECSLEEWLSKEGYCFDFDQAVRLIERLHPECLPIGEGMDPEKEPVRFSSRVGLDFPTGEVSQMICSNGDVSPYQMVVNFIGLAGAFGPLPHPYTELIIERSWYKDKALRDFLDIFNHRLVSLFYRIRKTYSIGFDFKSPEQSHFARYLYSLFGMGTEGLQDRIAVKDRSLLHYTGLLAQKPRSMTGLECLLSDYFHIPIKGRSLYGRWYDLEKDQLTAIGLFGQNHCLGQQAVLGTRIWGQQAKFEVVVGPLDFGTYCDFLPIGRRFRSLCQLTQFYIDRQFEFDVKLILKADEIPESRLSMTAGMRLGWTSWLKTEESKANKSVRLKTPTPL